MKIGLLSYPMLFQRVGGLQVQVRETQAALSRLGVDARIVNSNEQVLSSFDLVHVFAANNGNHRIVEFAKQSGVPVVLSSLIHGGSRWAIRRDELLDRLVSRLSGWELRTSHGDLSLALSLADRIVALGEGEKRALLADYQVPAGRVVTIPNGIARAFFLPDPRPFRERFAVEDSFVLCVGSINARKNQATLVRALSGFGLRIVLIGEAGPAEKPLLDDLLMDPKVTYLPAFAHDDPMLASAYAAASVLALPSLSEVMPLCVLEALAAGTPVVMTRFHQMNLTAPRGALVEIEPNDERGIRRAVKEACDSKLDRHSVSRSVEHLSWERVAQALLECYRETVAAKAPVALARAKGAR